MDERDNPKKLGTSPPRSRLALFLLLAFGLFSGGVMAFLTLYNPGQRGSISGVGGPTPVPDRVSEGTIAPDFSGVTPGGDTYSLAGLRGYPVAVNFWATWCAPCRVEMPELQAAYEAHSDIGFKILAVNAGESPDATREFMNEMGLTFPAVLDESGDIVELYEIRVFPTTIWIDGEGIVRAEHFGPLTSDLIEAYLEELSTPYSGEVNASQ